MLQADAMQQLIRQVQEAIADLPEYVGMEVQEFIPYKGQGGIILKIRLPEYPDQEFEIANLQDALDYVARSDAGLPWFFRHVLENTRQRLVAKGEVDAARV